MIIFRTPGTMDMRSFTTMGLSAKPNSDRPIGIFGTGLKYAVAVLTRLGAKFEVHTGGVRYWFETTPIDFRGGEFQQIVMRRDSWVGSEWRLGRRKPLPFTTQYGRNWEAWMAFRELYANTQDEGGQCFQWEQPRQQDEGINRWGEIESGRETVIIVNDCPAFEKAYEERDSIFLDLDPEKLLGATPMVEVREGKATQLYYQGLRAKDLPKPTAFTYNFKTSQNLTEDRQLAHEWALRSALANAVAQMDDERLIRQIVTVKNDCWEYGLAPDAWVTPSAAFRQVMALRPYGVGGGFAGYYRTHDDRPEVARKSLWADALRPWAVKDEWVIDASGQRLFNMPYDMNKGQWEQLAADLIGVANAAYVAEQEGGEAPGAETVGEEA